MELEMYNVPTRQSLIHDLIRHKVPSMVPTELGDLYHVLEADFQPLKLWERSQPALHLIEDSSDLGTYREHLHQVIVSKTLLQLSQVYQTIRFDELLKLCPFMTSIALERCVIELIHNLELPIRVNHRLQAIVFDEFTDLGISQCDYGGQLTSQSTHVNAPDKLSRQLTMFAQVMQQITEMLDKDQTTSSHRLALVQEYREYEHKFHVDLLNRRNYIEKRKEEVEIMRRERDQYFLNEEARRNAEQEKKMQHEEHNLLREAEERERLKTEDEQARLKRRIARGNYNLLMEHKMGVKLELTEEQLDQFDADKIFEKKAMEVKKKRKDTAEKAKHMAKKLDYFCRAVRLEEIPLLRAAIEPEAATAKEFYERSLEEIEQHAKVEHARQLKERNRLIRMKADVQLVVEKLKDKRDERFLKRLAEWEELCETTREQRLEELQMKREAEATAEAELRAIEEEEARLEEEEAAENERVKQEIKAKEAALREAAREEEEKRQEAKRAVVPSAAASHAPPSDRSAGSAFPARQSGARFNQPIPREVSNWSTDNSERNAWVRGGAKPQPAAAPPSDKFGAPNSGWSTRSPRKNLPEESDTPTEDVSGWQTVRVKKDTDPNPDLFGRSSTRGTSRPFRPPSFQQRASSGVDRR